MKIKDLVEVDCINYYKPSMFIATSKCDFKCDKEAGCQVCQNSQLAAAPSVEISIEELCERYLNNPITEAVVIGGLESFDTFEELLNFIKVFRNKSNDDIVIYTGYYPEEIKDKIEKIYPYNNILIKFGRFIPNQEPHFDNTLKINLASNNQFAISINDMEEYYEQRKNLQ